MLSNSGIIIIFLLAIILRIAFLTLRGSDQRICCHDCQGAMAFDGLVCQMLTLGSALASDALASSYGSRTRPIAVVKNLFLMQEELCVVLLHYVLLERFLLLAFRVSESHSLVNSVSTAA